MIRLLNIVPTPYLILGISLALIASHGLAYFKGFKRAEDKQAVAMLDQMQREREYLAAIDVLSRDLVSKYTSNQTKERVVYRTIKEKVNETTSGAVCINDNAARLWDNALLGSMPEATTGTAKETSGTYTDAQVVANAVENFEQYKECRNQLNALIDWHEAVD